MLRNFVGKQMLSFLRKGDFSHAGEIDSIELVMSEFEKNSSQCILDAGCGLGGTANYIAEQKWGRVYGFDIEESAIKYARLNYPKVNFVLSSAFDVHKFFERPIFDVICLFNSFYAFYDQRRALMSLSKVAKPEGQIAIFDYSNLCNSLFENPLFRTDENCPLIPIDNSIGTLLRETGWQVGKVVDVSEKYKVWYSDLLSKLEINRDFVLREYGEEAFNRATKVYNELVVAFDNRQLGGLVVYAKKI